MPFRDDLLTPVSPEKPGGNDLRYDPVRDTIKEARREEMEAPQGAWKTEVKIANWDQVARLAGELIAKRSKDLQLAVWLVDALVRKEGFTALAPGFQFLEGLLDRFWDQLFPEVEDDDLEERSGILSWLGTKLEEPIRLIPLVAGGLSWSSYKQSLTVGFEADANSQDLRQKRQQAINDGRVTGEQWVEAVAATPKAACEKLQADVQSSLEALAQLNATADRLFGRDSPSFTRVHTALDEIAGVLRVIVYQKGGPTVVAAAPAQPAVAPAPVAAAPATPAPAAPVYSPPAATSAAPEPASAPQTVGKAGIEPTDLADAERRLTAVCRFLRERDKYDIAPFLILRGLRFGQIRYNGPDKIDESMLEAPPSDLRSEFKRLAGEKDWDGLLLATERAMSLPCGRGWLDVQRYTVLALEGKGEWWAFVAEAVRTELRSLLADMPKLLEMNLLDDTPTANPETRKWIEESILSGQPPAPSAYTAASTPAAVPSVSEPVEDTELPALEGDALETQDEPFERAVTAAASGLLSEALATLSQQLATEHSGRGRFRRRLQMAHLLVKAGQNEVALPLLQDLAGEADRRSLETWEEAKALGYPLSLLLSCLQASNSNGDETAAVYARICKLDPARALTLPRA